MKAPTTLLELLTIGGNKGIMLEGVIYIRDIQ
jgi:hypothetical protein